MLFQDNTLYTIVIIMNYHYYYYNFIYFWRKCSTIKNIHKKKINLFSVLLVHIYAIISIHWPAIGKDNMQLIWNAY